MRFVHPGRVHTLILIITLLLITAFASLSLSASGGSNSYLPIIQIPSEEIVPFGSTYEGEGTWYYGDGTGNCLFEESEDSMFAALNNSQYGNAEYCGAYIRVRGPQGTVMVQIVDRCADCPYGNVDLSRTAFSQIAELSQGRVDIEWQFVSPPVTGDIIFDFKDGSNPWWTAVQIRNHRNPIARFEYRNSSGAWVEAPRAQWNYFVESSGMGSGPYTFRITDYFGNIIINNGIPLLDDAEYPGTGQFPPP